MSKPYSISEIEEAIAMIRNMRAREAGAISESSKLAAAADEFRYKSQEHFVVIALNNQLRVLAKEALFIGGINSCPVDVRIVAKFLIEHEATNFAIAHNHPSGNLSPSQGDRNITRKLANVGALLQITLMDHVIVSSEGYYSFADQGEECLTPNWK